MKPYANQQETADITTKKRQHIVKTHLANDDARLEKEASVPARWDGGWR
jgi:hypothetical protein